MAILNYTTKVPVSKTINEIHTLLIRFGAEKIMTEYLDKEPSGITFSAMYASGPILFTLPTNIRGVLKCLQKAKVEKRYLNEDQAKRVAWRILKDWIGAQLALVESDLADLPEVFLGYAHGKSGQTLWNEIKSSSINLLQ